MHDEFAEWYVEWAKEYLRLFGIATNENLTTLTLWGRSFDAMRFTYGEMKLAEAIVRNLPKETAPARVGDHYYAIKSAVISSREMTRQKIETNYDDSRGLCVDCGDSGFIIVPHPRFCNAMEWKPNGYSSYGDPIFTTCAVICRCWKGRKLADRQQADELEGKPPLTRTIGKYEETVNANWRNQMRERAEQSRTVASVESAMGAAA